MFPSDFHKDNVLRQGGLSTLEEVIITTNKQAKKSHSTGAGIPSCKSNQKHRQKELH